MVQHDSHAAIGFLHKAPGLVNAGDAACGIGEDHIPHGGGRGAMELNHLVHNLAIAPGFEGETLVLWEVRIMANKVSKRALAGGAKGLLS